tara:strand:- start:10071 stop:10418 length:348 start_codon:yes stop_codon:yes gene_type:complete
MNFAQRIHDEYLDEEMRAIPEIILIISTMIQLIGPIMDLCDELDGSTESMKKFADGLKEDTLRGKIRRRLARRVVRKELGSDIYNQINGDKIVEALINASADYPDLASEAYVSSL